MGQLRLLTLNEQKEHDLQEKLERLQTEKRLTKERLAQKAKESEQKSPADQKELEQKRLVQKAKLEQKRLARKAKEFEQKMSAYQKSKDFEGMKIYLENHRNSWKPKTLSNAEYREYQVLRKRFAMQKKE